MTATVAAAPAVPGSAGVSPDQAAELTRLARGGVLNVAGAGIASATNVLLVLAVTRGVPRAQAGVFFAATSAFLLVAAVARLGANTGLVYFVARLRALGRADALGRLSRVAFLPLVAASILLAGALWAFAEPLAGLVVRGNGAGAVPYLRALAVFLPLATVADAALSATRGFRQMRPTVVVDLIGRSGLQLALVGVVVLVPAFSHRWLAVAWGLPYLPAMVLGVLWLTALYRRDRRRTAHPAGPAAAALRARDFWRFTAPRAVSGVVQLALQRLDIILVAALRGPVDAAVYTAATRFLVVGQLGSQAIATVAQPRLSELLAVSDRVSANRVYQVSTGWLVLVTWPLYLLTAVFSTQLLAVFGHSYRAGSSVIVLLALAMLVATACGMVDVVLNMAGRTTWTLANSSLALAVNVGVDLALIPRLGIVGAAIGWAASIVLNNLVPLLQVSTSLRLHPFGRETGRAALLATGCFGALPLAARVLFGDAVPTVAAVVAVATGCFALACWWQQRPLALDALRGSAGTRSRRLGASKGSR